VSDPLALYTPGPWLVEGDDVVLADGTPIGRVYYVGPARGGVESTEANARLVAAAPDLLDALERLLVFADELCRDVGVSTHYPSAERARAAIRRALGDRDS
jgi:hypothetical protein